MRVSTKGRLAVAAVIDLGLRQHRGPVTLASIGQRQRISVSYLEQLFAKLLRHQLVESTRGPGGGYRLAKSMQSTSVADIVFAVDEPPDATDCARAENCENDQRCRTDELWINLNRQMIAFLDSVSVLDLVERQKSRTEQARSSRFGAQEIPHVDIY